MRNFVAAVVVVVSLHLFVSVGGQCPVANCSSMVTATPLPTNSSDLDLFCGKKVKILAACVNALNCPKNDSTTYSSYLDVLGSLNASNFLCSTPRIMQTYLENRDCFAAALGESERNCSIASSDTLNCAARNNKLMCRLNQTQIQCNNKTVGRLLATFIARKEQPVLMQINCSLELPFCTRQQMMNCSAMQPNMSQPFPTMCNRTEDYNRCLNQSMDCIPGDELYSNYTAGLGQIDAYRYMCLSNVTQVFQQNMACAQSNTKPVMASCMNNSFPAYYANASMADLCLYNNRMYQCVYLNIKTLCNEETARMMADFNVKQYRIPLMANTYCNLETPYAECAQASLDAVNSTKPAMPFNLTTNSWNSTAMNTFCSASTQFALKVNGTSCLKNDTLYKPLQSYVAARNGLQYLCSDTVRPVFLGNQKCFTVNLEESGRTCYKTYSPDNITTDNIALCRAYDSVHKCMYNATRGTCGETVARTMITLAVKNREQHLNALYGCTFDVASYWISDPSAATALTSRPMILFSILIVCLSLIG